MTQFVAVAVAVAAAVDKKNVASRVSSGCGRLQRTGNTLPG